MLPPPTPQVSIIIPVFNKWELTKNCLESLARHTSAEMVEVIVVDNASTDETVTALETLGCALFGEAFTRIRWEKNHNFGPACNAGAAMAKAGMLFFLNNDTLLTPDWLPPLLEAFEKDTSLGAVGPLLLYEDNTVQHLGVTFAPRGVYHLYASFPANHPLVQKKRFYQAITGAAFMVPKTIFTAVGGFFEEYKNGFEDVELSLRIHEKGYRLTCVPESTVYHLESQSPNRNKYDLENSERFASRCSKLFHMDTHIFGIADGFTPFIDDQMYLHLRINKQESNILLKTALKHGIEGIRWMVEANPLWLEGKETLATMLELEGRCLEAAHYWLEAAKFGFTKERTGHITRLTALAEGPQAEIIRNKYTSLYNSRQNDLPHKQFCALIIMRAKAQNDTALATLYENVMEKLQ